MKEVAGNVFDIQRYSIHDGPGIRTVVFLKGCPLKCKWCANPESQNTAASLFYLKKKCVSCGYCASVCPSGAIAWDGQADGIVIDRTKCKTCFRCVGACPTGALLRKGRQMSVREVLAEATKDRVFFHKSGGGVTLSGGEPLLQYEFALAILKGLKDQNIHTALETTGVGLWDNLESLSSYADVVLFDFKHIDPTVFHRNVAQVDVPGLYQNMVRLVHTHKNVVVRIPVIPGFNADSKSIGQMISFLKENHIHKIELLKFHQLGASKYESLGQGYDYRDVPMMAEEEFKFVQTCYQEAGFSV